MKLKVLEHIHSVGIAQLASGENQQSWQLLDEFDTINAFYMPFTYSAI